MLASSMQPLAAPRSDKLQSTGHYLGTMILLPAADILISSIKSSSRAVSTISTALVIQRTTRVFLNLSGLACIHRKPDEERTCRLKGFRISQQTLKPSSSDSSSPGPGSKEADLSYGLQWSDRRRYQRRSATARGRLEGAPPPRLQVLGTRRLHQGRQVGPGALCPMLYLSEIVQSTQLPLRNADRPLSKDRRGSIDTKT